MCHAMLGYMLKPLEECYYYSHFHYIFRYDYTLMKQWESLDVAVLLVMQTDFELNLHFYHIGFLMIKIDLLAELHERFNVPSGQIQTYEGPFLLN